MKKKILRFLLLYILCTDLVRYFFVIHDLLQYLNFEFITVLYLKFVTHRGKLCRNAYQPENYYQLGFFSGDIYKQLFYPIFIPIGVAGNILSFLVMHLIFCIASSLFWKTFLPFLGGGGQLMSML